MAPLIRDGVYIIRNGEFNTFAVDHLYVSRYGPVVAYTEGPQNRYNKVRAVLRGGILPISLIVDNYQRWSRRQRGHHREQGPSLWVRQLLRVRRSVRSTCAWRWDDVKPQAAGLTTTCDGVPHSLVPTNT